MENFINNIGGYNSLTFAIISLSTYFLGGGLIAVNKLKWIGLIIYIFAVQLILGWVIFNTHVDTFLAIISPFIFVLMALLAGLRLWFLNEHKEQSRKTESKPNCSLTPNSPACSVCPKKCF